MDTALAIAALLLGVVGIIGCVVPVLPGLIFSYAGLLCAFFCEKSDISTSAIWIWLAITIAVSVADYFFPAYLTRKFGGSRAASVGATIGLVVGVFFTPIGMILGTFLGSVIGELIHDRSDAVQALKSGVGSFFSFIISTGVKITISFILMFIIFMDVWSTVIG